MNQRNNFGPLSAEYDSARRGYPKELYEYLYSIVKAKPPSVLDIGCGTGISTRELDESGFDVVGADKDAGMIEVAQKNSSDIEYVVAPADNLPFPDSKFDMVVAFTSFHWFNEEKSLLEIRRVLKNGGIFFAALKGNRKNKELEVSHRRYMDVLKKYAGKNFDSTKEHFNLDYIRSLFSDVTKKSFYVDEKYTVEDALELIRSLSLWSLVSEKDRSNFLNELRALYEESLVDGFVVKSREIFTFFGKK